MATHDKVLWRCKCSVFLCKHSFPLKQNVSEVNIGHVNVSGGVSTTRKWSAYIPVIQGLNYFPFNIESVLLEYSLNTGENADPPFKLLNHEFKMALVSSSSFNLETIRYTYNWDLLSAFVFFAFFLHLLLFPFFCFFFFFKRYEESYRPVQR